MKDIKRIAIAGAGGLGSYLTQFLFDYGVNRSQYPWSEWTIDLFDDDTVDVSNLLHQNFREDDLGKNKADILAEKFFVTPNLRFMTAKDFPKYDVIFSCVDSMPFRQELAKYGEEHKKLFWIDGRCNSRNIGVFNSLIPYKKLEPFLKGDEVRRGCLREIDKQNKTSHATPIVVAGMMTQVFLNYLRDEVNPGEILLLV